MEPKWLEWTKRLQAIAQTGLTYARDPYDIERYEMVRQVAAELLAYQTDGDLRSIVDLFSLQMGHATPKVDVRGAVFQKGMILLVRDQADGLWTLLGGWADVQESPREAVEREVLEETGSDPGQEAGRCLPSK